jgi:hypothetical protein
VGGAMAAERRVSPQGAKAALPAGGVTGRGGDEADDCSRDDDALALTSQRRLEQVLGEDARCLLGTFFHWVSCYSLHCSNCYSCKVPPLSYSARMPHAQLLNAGDQLLQPTQPGDDHVQHGYELTPLLSPSAVE